MNVPVIFQFLKELSANNNREWFNAHRMSMKMPGTSLRTC